MSLYQVLEGIYEFLDLRFSVFLYLFVFLYIFFYCVQWLKKTRRKALFASLEKIKEGELSVGFNNRSS